MLSVRSSKIYLNLIGLYLNYKTYIEIEKFSYKIQIITFLKVKYKMHEMYFKYVIQLLVF